MCPVPRKCSATVDDRVLVHAALDDHVHLDGREARCGSGVDSGEDLIDGIADVVHRHEDGVVHRVEAHGHPIQAGLGQRFGLSFEQRAVGGEGQVFEALDLGQHGDQVLDPLSQQWLSPGEPDLGDPLGREDGGDAGDLLEREQLISGEELVVLAEDLLRHAIGAAEVAAIGHRDTQIPYRSSHRVGDTCHGERVPGFGDCEPGARTERSGESTRCHAPSRSCDERNGNERCGAVR